MSKEIEKGKKISTAVEFEDAIAETGFGWYNITLLVVCGISLMAVIMETLSMSFILPAAQCDLKLTLDDKGMLSSVGFLGVVLSSLLWGFIGDTTGRRNVVLITSYISFLAGIASSFANQVWVLVFLRFINCFFIGGPSAVVIAYLGEFHGLNYRARVITLSATFVAGASMFLPGIAWLVLPMEWSWRIPILDVVWRPWRLLIILYGLPSFISATCLLFLPESPKYLWAVGKSDDALGVLRKIYAANTGNDTDTFPITTLIDCNEKGTQGNVKPVNFKDENIIVGFFKLVKQQMLPIFCPPLLTRTFMTSFLQFGTFAASSGVLMWLPEIVNTVSLYLEQTNSTYVTVCDAFKYRSAFNTVDDNTSINSNNTDIDYVKKEECSDAIDTGVYEMSLSIGAAFAVTYMLITIVIKYTGKKKLLAGLLVVTGTAGIATNFMESYLLITLLCGLFVVGGAGVTILNTVVVDLFPTQYRSIAMAVSLMFGRFGAMLASTIIGYLLEFSCSSVFYFYGGEYIFLGLLSLLLPSS